MEFSDDAEQTFANALAVLRVNLLGHLLLVIGSMNRTSICLIICV